MRGGFVDTLCRLAETDDRIWLLTGDLGFMVLEPFAERFPERFVNAGVAEQNMIGVAAGLALTGKIPFVYSLANFPLMRCLEQIRNDVCYHDLPVRVVALGGGLTYGSLGYTHHGLEDLAIMRALPNMTVLAPGDPAEAAAATEALIRHPGPAYLRLGRAGERQVHQSSPDFRIGRAITTRTGTDCALVATGAALPIAMDAAAMLAEQGTEAMVLSFHTLDQPDLEALSAAADTGTVVTVEEHGVGGLASVVAECLIGRPVAFHSLKIGPEILAVADSQDGLRARHGFTAEAIADLVRQ
ncbi:transketolase family protein [Magnetospira sp. QH-2]|uniref:transketolase family protein n=1 Tax=Magnetospira sp. (strain QH-2) TaxID=1288970 RepID=UPI0003E81704|nr:transketolase C-terminal domain-containing protein [Magnetospira sp. QH-2]CCQ72162.1 transketolase (C-terminal subunit) [Magnetospira sp. QH-2]